MGFTIHYSGKAKSRDAIDQLIDILREISEESGWSYYFVHGKVKGKFEPFWGYGYGYVPRVQEMKAGNIHFFPRMIGSKCNGYFKIFDTKYAAHVMDCLGQGTMPTFTIDTMKKGIQLDIHPKCETLSFIFDLSTLELANYEVYAHTRGVVFGYNGFSCKTGFAGSEVHRIVCKLIKMASRFIDYAKVYDESGYYETEDNQAAENKFATMDKLIQWLVDACKRAGFNVSSEKNN